MTRFRVNPLVLLAGTVLLLDAGRLAAQQPGKSPQEWIDAFAASWQETDWQTKARPYPDGYMRPLDDAGWKTRMLALQGLVSHGREAVPVLLRALETGDVAQRILAAQTLGYLAPDVPSAPLLQAAQRDPHSAVRLYAVDALGMKGTRDVDWNSLLEAEADRDVRKHIGYAIERNGEPIAASVVKQLLAWDPQTIDSAVVGRPAPDFELTSAGGKTVRLRDFRGKQPVILVFVYGDT